MERSVSEYVIVQSAIRKQCESWGRHVMECDGMKWKKRETCPEFVTYSLDSEVSKARAEHAARRRARYTSREHCLHSQATAGSSRASVTIPRSVCLQNHHLATAGLALGTVPSARSQSCCRAAQTTRKWTQLLSAGEESCSCRRQFWCSRSSRHVIVRQVVIRALALFAVELCLRG